MRMTERNPETRQLAHDRTDLAEDRTVLAAERTFAGWMRTAFAAIGIGIAFRGLFGALEPAWLPRAIATVFIAAGAIMAASAERRATRTFRRLSAHEAERPEMAGLRWIAYSVVVGALVLIVALWWMQEPTRPAPPA